MEPYQERVVQEQNDLVDKIEKLEKFIASDVFSGLDLDEQRRLIDQLAYMNGYNDVLTARIEAF